MDIRIVTEEDVERVKGNSKFGTTSPYTMVKDAVLKCASGYASGSTITQICRELGLITKGYSLTKKGKRCLWEWYSRMSNPPRGE